MEKRFKLIIEYDGTGFHGWQRQPGDRTVQAEVEGALKILTGSGIVVHGSGRTDAGVHAFGQTAHFTASTRLSPPELLRGLNGLLPQDVSVKSCEEADPSFHARKSAEKKTYAYHIINRPVRPVLLRNHTWHIRKPLDLSAMNRAASFLVGTHDFKSFEGSGSPRTSTVRTIFSASFDTAPASGVLYGAADGLIVFSITADGFLRCMVRNIVGTMVEAGFGKIAPEAIPSIITARDRSKAGPTAPPQGLFLVEVVYRLV